MRSADVGQRLKALNEDDGTWIDDVLGSASPEQVSEARAMVAATSDMPEPWLRRDLAYLIKTFL